MISNWCQLKYMEALPLLRIITGSKEKEAVDRVWQDVTLKSIGPDGLFYIPLTGRPWGRFGVSWGDNGVARADGSLTGFATRRSSSSRILTRVVAASP